MNRKHKLSFAAITVLAMSFGSYAFASVDNNSSNQTIYGCVVNGSGNLTKISRASKPCSKGTTAIKWNVVGPKGDQGVQGPKGDIAVIPEPETVTLNNPSSSSFVLEMGKPNVSTPGKTEFPYACKNADAVDWVHTVHPNPGSDYSFNQTFNACVKDISGSKAITFLDFNMMASANPNPHPFYVLSNSCPKTGGETDNVLSQIDPDGFLLTNLEPYKFLVSSERACLIVLSNGGLADLQIRLNN